MHHNFKKLDIESVNFNHGKSIQRLTNFSLAFKVEDILEIVFKTKELRRICESKCLAKERFGEKLAKKLQNRIADLFAAQTVYDIILGNPQEIMVGNEYAYQLNFGLNNTIVFTSGHINARTSTGEKINWNKVSRVKILSIGGVENAC